MPFLLCGLFESKRKRERDKIVYCSCDRRLAAELLAELHEPNRDEPSVPVDPLHESSVIGVENVDSLWNIRQPQNLRRKISGTLGRSPVARAAAAQLSSPAEPLAFLGESADLVGVDYQSSRSDLFRPDLTLADHHPYVFLRASVDLGGLRRAADVAFVQGNGHLHVLRRVSLEAAGSIRSAGLPFAYRGAFRSTVHP
jgi:hypothetical protein